MYPKIHIPAAMQDKIRTALDTPCICYSLEFVGLNESNRSLMKNWKTGMIKPMIAAQQ